MDPGASPPQPLTVESFPWIRAPPQAERDPGPLHAGARVLVAGQMPNGDFPQEVGHVRPMLALLRRALSQCHSKALSCLGAVLVGGKQAVCSVGWWHCIVSRRSWECSIGTV